MLYQLSYFRKNKPHQSSFSLSARDVATPIGSASGKRWIRTTEGVRQQIYSLPHLATLVSSQLFNSWTPSRVREPMEGFEPTTPRLQITCSGQLSYIGISTVTGCKGRDIFYICKFFSSFFSNPLKFCANRTHLARSKNGDFRPSKVKVGKSSANITTLSLIKKQMKVFFAKKLKKCRFRHYLYNI